MDGTFPPELVRSSAGMRSTVEEIMPLWPRRREPHVWYDTAKRDAASLNSILSRIATSRFDAIVVYPQNADELGQAVSPRLRRVLELDTPAELAAVMDGERLRPPNQEPWIVASRSVDVLEQAREHQLPCCLRAGVGSASELHAAIEGGLRYPWLLLAFKDVTNIPLELAVATLQNSGTTLIRETPDPNDVEGAIVSLGVVEWGADGVMFSPAAHDTLDRFLERLDQTRLGYVPITIGTVTRTTPVGMGHRTCVDLITLFTKSEGLLVGSTSQGGLLCCAEVFPMPYMDLRPFRVNAGAVHSYVYGPDGKTNYLSELRAGLPVMVVGTDGTARPSTVGRIKTEVRPLRLVETEFGDGACINLFLQDDWHVRIFSAEGLPICLSNLKPGDQVLGHVASPGRHVGIKIVETIIEG